MGMTRPLLAILCVLASPRPAVAGMPTIELTDIARARFQVISFFLMVLLLCARGVKGIWNSLARDFPKLPHLSFGKASGLVALWGLLFLLVLTMISGARELMTPGAWEKVGLTSRLANPPTPEVFPRPDRRQAKLETLRAGLWAYARNHGGHFPPDDSPTAEIPEEAWRTPDSPPIRYLYVPGRRPGGGYDEILAYEPTGVAADRYVLNTVGNVRRMTDDDLSQALHAHSPDKGEAR